MSFGFLRRLRGALLGAAGMALLYVTASAVAGSGVGGIFNLGENNTVNQQTQLTGNSGGNPQLRVENAATNSGASGVLGKMTSSSAAADAAGVRGINAASGANGFGVLGLHQGSGAGVFGQSGAGTGVLGKHTGAGGVNAGIEGRTGSTDALAAGVRGVLEGSTGAGAGVEGRTSSATGTGIHGINVNGNGVFGSGLVGVRGCGTPFGSCALTISQDGIGGYFHAPAKQGVGVFGCVAGSQLCLDFFFGGVAGEFVAQDGIGVVTSAGGIGTESTGGPAGVLGAATSTDGVGVTGTANSGSSAVGILGHSDSGLAGKFEGNVHVTGKLTRAYTAGTASQATPIAYGAVTGGGSTVTTASTPNVTSTFDSVNKRYVITIAGESYDINHYVTTVTPINTVPRFVATQSGGGKLFVRIFDLSGTAVQTPFEFVTYKP